MYVYNYYVNKLKFERAIFLVLNFMYQATKEYVEKFCLRQKVYDELEILVININ